MPNGPRTDFRGIFYYTYFFLDLPAARRRRTRVKAKTFKGLAIFVYIADSERRLSFDEFLAITVDPRY